jgi:hypothetical protein
VRGRTHGLLARRIVLCYIKSLHNLMCLLLIVAVSHSGHRDSLVRGIVICYTKSVGTPHRGHGGRVVCTPVERGRARCCRDSSKFCWLVALWLYALPPTHPPPALHVLGLTCCPTTAPQHRESPLAQKSVG